MLKFQSNKIKNPLLKQIGQIFKNENEIKDTREIKIKEIKAKDISTDKKINLEILIEFVHNFDKNDVPESNSIKDDKDDKDDKIDKIDKNDKIDLLDLNHDKIDLLDLNHDKNDPDICQFKELRGLKKNLSEIIDGLPIKRFGVLKSMPGKLKFYSNLSFLSSLSICVNEKFLLLDEGQQFTYLKSLKLYINNSFNKNFYDINNYKELSKDYNFDKLEVSKNLYNFDLTRNEFLVISDIFHINLFILDSSRDKLFYAGTRFVPYKKNLFILKKEDGFYEPLNLDDKFFIDHENDFIQYLIENNKKVELFFRGDKFKEFTIHVDEADYFKRYLQKEVKLDITNKILERRLYNLNRTDKENNNINDNINEDINDYTENKNIPDYNVASEICSLSDSDSDSDSESECNKIKYDNKNLESMKLNEICLIAKSLNIQLDHKDSNNKLKKKTKASLIKEILKK